MFTTRPMFQLRYAEILDDETSLYMEGLLQPIECLVCSSNAIVCSDLAGDIMTWNASTGETISKIERTSIAINNMNADDDYKLQQQVRGSRGRAASPLFMTTMFTGFDFTVMSPV